MLRRAPIYSQVYDTFRWEVPAEINMGVEVCDRHLAARPDALALIAEGAAGQVTKYTFQDLARLSNRMANLLTAKGLGRGDRVGILLSQSVETGVAHIAAWKAGFISIPLFTLFGEHALEYRLADSGARALVTDLANLPKIQAIRERLPKLELLLVTGAGANGDDFLDLWPALERASDRFAPLRTRSEDPALIVYTSGTTGPPKGALHAHRTILGHLPGVEFPHEFFPQPGDRMWTPADWAWIGGLMNVLMVSWYHGVAVVAHRAGKYDPEEALRRMARHGVRNTFMPPTALKMMRQIPDPKGRFGFDLRTVTCAGEPMGAELLEWGREKLGITFNEFYGQTECNLVVAGCAEILEVKPGSMGVPVPGHRIEVIDAAGNPLPRGEVGTIAVARPDPVMFLEYWRDPEATAAKYLGDWLLTGDQATMDEDGYLWFVGRDDDLITSAGYRIGPGEIEDCLTRHPAVALAAVIGVPDELRTEVVKAFIVLRHEQPPGVELETSIRDFVKTHLSPHEYPRVIEFVDDLPMTATGKIRRRDLRTGNDAPPKS